jgi:hypothetical protein
MFKNSDEIIIRVGGLQDEQRFMGLCSVSHEFSSAFILFKYKVNSGSQLLTGQATGHEFPMSLFVYWAYWVFQLP